MIPTWIQAVVLGIVQGLTEFVPVSSSGHLVLTPYLLGWERPGLAFDVALHLGTALAIVIFFRRELVAMARGVLRPDRAHDGRLHRRLALLIATASVPVVVVGLTLEDIFAETFESPLVVSYFLLLTALILVGGERWRDRRVRLAVSGEANGDTRRAVHSASPAGGNTGEPAITTASELGLPTGADAADPSGVTLERIGLRHAVIVGLAQTLALFPGVSRSGTTIMAGVAAGLTRAAATRFSFLMALPPLVGAGLLKAGDLAEPGIYSGTDMALGVVAAFVSGYLAIKFLVALVSRERLTAFAYYVVGAAAIGIVAYLAMGPPGGA